MNWPWKRKTTILGSEAAAAQQREKVRIAAGEVGETPLPPDRYDKERGDYDLVTISPSKLDLDLRDLTENILDWDQNRRNELRQIIPSDELYTLIHFVKRASVLGLNSQPVEWCRAGMIALSMIDETRVDWRDFKWSAGLIEHSLVARPEAAHRLKEDLRGFSRLTSAFFEQLPEVSHLRDWGYSEIQRGDSIGLIQTGYAKYDPTLDLTGVALRIRENLSNGRYIAEVEIATELPEVWFDRNRRDGLGEKLKHCKGAAIIRGDLRRNFGDSFNQLLLVWVIEMPSSDDCESLMEAVGTGTPLTGRFAAGVSEGKLFTLAVGGSFQVGIEPFESPSSLRELAEEMRLVLKSAVA